jgi:dihydrofolate reductase
LRIFEHMSLDGVIQHSDDGDNFAYPDWTAPCRSPEGAESVLRSFGENFDLLLGRRTYDIWSGYWPKAPNSPMADRLNSATKYVLTHRPESLTWGPSEPLGPDFLDRLRDLKSNEGPDLILWGSSTMTSKLIENGLADELKLFVHPVLLGHGKKLFAVGTPARALTLKSAEPTPSGILICTYHLSHRV